MLALAAGAAQAEPAAIGEVTALSGAVTAVGDGGNARALGCGDAVYEGEQVVTEAGAGAGLLLGSNLLATLGESSSLGLGRTPEGAPDAALSRGSVRVIDAREDAAAARLAVGPTLARVAGGDAEAYVLSEKTGAYAMFCEWDSPLPVERGREARTAAPEQCVIAKPHEALYLAKAHPERMPAGPDACPPRPVAEIAAHFPPETAIDVAAGPPLAFSAGLTDLPGLAPQPCDVPGSVCPGAVIVVDEDPPGDDDAPGLDGAPGLDD
jgi:hypothetical protein